MQHYLIHSLIMLCFTTAIVFSGVAPRLKRSVHDKNASLIPCATAFQICEGNERCSAAFSKLDQRCTVIGNRCNAKMKDLPRCGQIMDHLFGYGLPEEGCKCTEENPECIGRQKKIYGNQCFVAIRHLRKQHLFPKKLDAYDKVTKFETTTAVTSSAVTEIQHSGIVDRDAQRLMAAHPKIHTVDEVSTAAQMSQNMQYSRKMTIARPTSSGTSSKSLQPQDGVDVAKADAESTTEISVSSSEHIVPSTKNIYGSLHRKSSHDTNTENDVNDDSKSPFAMNLRLHSRFKANDAIAAERQLSMEMARQRKLDKSHNNTDYKSIAIILGILLAIFVLSSLIVFLWTRTSNTGFYMRSKFMKDRRMDDEIYSTMQFLPSSSNRS